jgi:hypothetical protein
MAAIGAVGDGFFVEGRLVSQNREVAMESVRQGFMEIKEQGEKEERYIHKSAKGDIPYDELAAYLEILGAVGYYESGPDMGVRVCFNGIFPESDRIVERLKARKNRAFDAEIARLQEGAFKKSPHLQWLHVEDRFSPMGVKMIGVFCDTIRDTAHIDPQKYIAAFQIIPNEIPGFGPIPFDEVKVSMRVSPYLEGEIRAGRAMGLDVLLPEATNRLGGFSDACHSLTAATTVAIGKEEELIEEMERILSE